MHSIPLGPSERISLLCNSTKKGGICAIHREKTHFGAFPKAKKLPGALSFMHKGPKCIQSLWDHPNKFLLCKSTKKARYVRSLGQKSHFAAFQEAKKANWRSQLHAQGSKMHSIPLGPSEKNSFCAKAQIKRDMCDP